MSQSDLKISPFQGRVLSIPEELDVFLGGGRGGAKSYTMALLILRYVEQYAERARILYIRQSYKGIADFETICRELFTMAYGGGCRYNQSDHAFRFPNGAYLELGQLEGPADYSKYQGRSFGLILIDEAGQYASPDLLDRLRSNLRGPKDLPIRVVLAANPGDVGHQWIASRYVFKAKPWTPFYEEKSRRQWVHAPSTFLDNPFIDQDEYKRQLQSSCPGDPELLRAWLEGDWAVARGAYFGQCLAESRNAIDPWPRAPHRSKDFDPIIHGSPLQAYLAHDFGSSAPSVTYVVYESPGASYFDRWFPRGSLILADELATNEPGNVERGMGYTVPRLAEEIRTMCRRWRMKPEGVADDAIFAKTGHGAGSISDEFRAAGVSFLPAKKADRLTGWNILRRLMEDAGKPDVPGLYVSRSCEYFWKTVPYLARDPRRIEDVDSRGPDHAADAARYGALRHRHDIAIAKLKGL